MKGEMLSTAMAVAKAMQVSPKPLTVNGVRYDGSEAVDIAVGSVPIVASVEEMTDTARQYALEETGTIWRYRMDGSFTDVLKTAEKEVDDGYPYNVNADGTLIEGGGVGWRQNIRINSSGQEEEEKSRVDLTGYIPVLPGQTVYMRGVTLAYYQSGYQSNNLTAYRADKTLIGTAIYVTSQWHPAMDENGVYSFTVTEKFGTVAVKGIAYIRLQLREILPGAVISLDRYPEGEEMGFRWVDTGIPAGNANETLLRSLESRTAVLETQAALCDSRVTSLERAEESVLPEWWQEYLPARLKAIRAHQDEGGRDAFSLIVMSDIHESGNLGGRTGAVAQAVMDGCGIGLAVDLGDFSTRASVNAREDMEVSMSRAAAILAPIEDRLLRTVGNHDGAWGNEGGTYVNNFSEKELYNRVFRPVAVCQSAVFDADGVGYYVDDPHSRARFVVLNTHHTKGERNYFSYHRLGQSQFNLLVQALGTLPDEDWCLLLFCHVPPVWGVDYDGDGVEEVSMADAFPEQVLLRSLVRAFTERQSDFSGSYGSAGAWDAVSLWGIDFSEAKGAVAACFSGHLHGDAVYGAEQEYPFPVITVRCDAPAEKFAEQAAESRVAGTCTEHSFDAVTVVRTASGFTIYLDKIGAGTDRVVHVEV